MASASAPKIEYRHNVAAGRHEIGVKSGKVFVPFATLSDAYFDQLAENAQASAGDNDDDQGEEGAS
jgi:hypothetical protein